MVVLIMRLLVLLVDLVLVVLNLMELLVHLPNHHKTLVSQIFNNMVMLVEVGLVLEVMVVVAVVLVELAVLMVMVESVEHHLYLEHQ